MRVKSICIVGGGSSGWMSAALLSKNLPETKIILIESNTIKPIGVGESTLAEFNYFLNALGLEDKDWMPYCDATYKTSIAFKNFRDGNGERFHYPFGHYDLNGKESLEIFYLLQKKYGEELYSPEEFARFVNKDVYLAEFNKISKTTPNPTFDFKFNIAYHLNANKFGEFLKNKFAIPNGVITINADLNTIKLDDEGYIDYIIADNKLVKADLFLDCTGFKSLLLENSVNSEFISFEDQLPNNSALVSHIPYTNKETEMKNYTDCVAMNYGWSWNIPLWSDIGVGYVYSDKFVDDNKVESEFKKFLNIDCDLRKITIKHGKHKKAWLKNVIGIGLSYAFIEPLESTGLLTTHQNLLVLSNILKDRKVINKFDIDFFNQKTDNYIDVMKNFVVLHWILSSRDDNEYWNFCREKIDYRGDIFNVMESLFNKKTDNVGFAYIMAGMNYKLQFPIIDDYSYYYGNKCNNIHDGYMQEKKYMLQWIKDQKSHYHFLCDNVYGSK